MAFSISGMPYLSSIPVIPKNDLKMYGMTSINEEYIPTDDPPASPKENWPLGPETNTHRRNKSSMNMLTANGMGIRKWDGKSRRSIEWDGLRRDPELWYPEGDCLVYLYGRGQSMRGPAFRVPLNVLVDAKCQPLLDAFMSKDINGSPLSDVSEALDEYFSGASDSDYVELYIPAPIMAERGEAFLYHAATRNFFAWVFKKSLVGQDLGSALVGLLNSMSQFRSTDANNVDDIVAYIDGEGYADMRNTPDHALGIMYFAEHFHFKDMWIDALAHCAGMCEKLHNSPGFESLSRQDRVFISRARLEMDLRLDTCGKMLSGFLTEELADTCLQLSPDAQIHLEKFRAFLQRYYTAKLGSYPSLASRSGSGAFSKSLFKQMRSEFEKLYEFLADSTVATTGNTSASEEELDVLHAVMAFDRRYQIEPLPFSLPLLPDDNAKPSTKPLSKRLTFTTKIFPKSDKTHNDSSMDSMNALDKATNRQNLRLTECTLVRAYRGFEKECATQAESKMTAAEKISQAEGRKIRWIVIYSSLQILIQATKVPNQVRATQNVAYNISIRIGECPPWNDRRSCYNLIRTQSAQANRDYRNSLIRSNPSSAGQTPIDVIAAFNDYLAQRKQSVLSRRNESALDTTLSTKKIIEKVNAGNALTIMPELQHPSPRRNAHHEILIEGHGYGLEDGLADVPITNATKEEYDSYRNQSSSTTSSIDASSQWSRSSHDHEGMSFESSDVDSPRTSGSFTSDDRRGSISSVYSEAESLEQPFAFEQLHKPRPVSTYSVSIYEEDLIAGGILPDPLFSPRTFDKKHVGPPPLFISKLTQKRVSILSQKLDKHVSVGSIMVMNEELAAYLKV
ncbi:uncharacterized protein EAF01_007412 [Botrytis porri]|uniref:DUF8004 domain-containing protein n=1 Tax=Botrytis porri TaxID=87229 RepID=A0A4Z1KPW5_9HELO|nr:uncharacterized protein EAF01_007412 [Botrytis porri]KAF7902114.1 hypothetical protein EAF01_007412 [Botrytis porri]TGO85804.1 hypothetical protein BPOR_0362g00050 [Botrytis porri]